MSIGASHRNGCGSSPHFRAWVDLEDPVLRVEPDLAQEVAGELAEDERAVVVLGELGRVRVVRVEVVWGRAVRADAAAAELGEELRAGAA
jgi:hypothetical protein